ncbi:MAG: glycosyltransferase [Candidatus Dormibacteraeota bacterium]|nr:glycosyltransferase [Candidatus Dormibacteraeota bacterium]
MSGVSVVISTYSKARSALLMAAVRSLRQQTFEPLEVIVVVDHSPELLGQLRDALPGVVLIESGRTPGLSGTRNQALEACRGELVAFLDDDAAARPDWIARLLAHFSDPAVMAVGGRTESIWEVGRPDWFPVEFDWVVGGSYRGLPEAAAEVRNVIGNNMAFRTDLVREVGGFREDMGRVGTRPVGCEETELCIRMRQRWPEQKIVYEPLARISHHVPRERARVRYYVSRCFGEGLSKAKLASFVGGRDATQAERRHVLRTLPRSAALDALQGARRLQLGGLLRGAAIIAGVAAAAAGFLLGNASARLPSRA